MLFVRTYCIIVIEILIEYGYCVVSLAIGVGEIRREIHQTVNKPKEGVGRMPRERRTEQLTVRMLPSIKELLRKSAEEEKLTMSEFLEIMILDYCAASENEE